MSAYRTVRLYFRFLGTHLRGSLEHPSDFWIMLFAVVLTQAANIIFLKAIFSRIPTLNGWGFWSVVVMFGLVSLGEGICNLFFEGMWRLAFQINQGELDYFLARPYPVVLQVTSTQIGLNGVGNVTSGLILVTVGVIHTRPDASPVMWAAGLVLLLSSITVKIAISLASNAASFWVAGPNPLFAAAIHQGGELARYPLTLYPYALRAVLILAVPFAFVSFFPVAFLAGSALGWIGLLTPLVAVYAILAARLTFRRGLLRYESVGN